MIKVGIIGSGFGLYGLLPAFNSTPGCKVVSIYGEKTDRLLSYCEKIGLKKIYTDWKKMLDNEQLDAIAIAVPPNVQYEIAKVALGMRIHILAEKPLAATYRQARELLDLAREKKIIHAIDFIFPEIEQWKKVKEMIDKKTFGKLRQIFLNWDFQSYDIKNKKSSWKTDTKEGGGALSFYFSHSLHYLEYFAGKILNFESLLSYSKESLNGADTGVDLLLKFENSTTGYAHLCCNVSGLNRHQLIFICEKGTIVLENENRITANFTIKIHTENNTKQLPIPHKHAIKTDEDERVGVLKKLTSRFISSIINKNELTPSFEEGLRVQKLIEEIRAANNRQQTGHCHTYTPAQSYRRRQNIPKSFKKTSSPIRYFFCNSGKHKLKGFYLLWL